MSDTSEAEGEAPRVRILCAPPSTTSCTSLHHHYMYSACSSAAGSAARSDSCCCWIQFQYWICDAYAYNCTTVRVHEQSYTYGTGSSTVLDLLLDLYSTGNSTTYRKKTGGGACTCAHFSVSTADGTRTVPTGLILVRALQYGSQSWA